MTKKLLIVVLSLLMATAGHARNPRGGATQPAAGSGVCGGSGPTLTTGQWANITPNVGTTPSPWYGFAEIALDPSNHATIYALADQMGIWKSTNCGNTWVRLGTPPAVAASPGNSYTTSYLDSPVRMAVDPSDSTHLVATQGVRGTALGFWVSHNGGNTWTQPTAFYTMAGATSTSDVTSLAIDPTNFNHILVGSHGDWASSSYPGVMETTDGGTTWSTHLGDSTWPNGSYGLGFAYDPSTSQGNSTTWLVGTDGDGFWRTTNSGSSWTQVIPPVSSGGTNTPHGGVQFVYTPTTGVLYAGGTPHPIRSTDNGVTWTVLSNIGTFYYYGVWNDGVALYTQASFASSGGSGVNPSQYLTSSISDGINWANYASGQTFLNGPYDMKWDATDGIMYAAQWVAGVYVLKPR